jgi:hypothetical protein
MTRGIMLGDDPGTMTKAGGGDDGRKRPWNPTSSSQKKSKKLSPLALRALAALEHEGGISSSDDERDAKDSRLHDISHSASGVSGVSEKSSIKTAARLEIDTVRSVVPLTEREPRSDKSRNAVLHNESDAGRGFDDRAHELHHIEHRGSGEDIRERNNAEICQNFHSPGASQVRKVHHNNERNPNMRAFAGSVSAGSLADNEPEDDSPVAGGRIEEDEDCVCPHVTTSDYGDVLSCFLSTPFDDKEMLSLHTSKEGTKTVELQINSKRRKWEYVPVLPQKIFIKSVKGKIIPTNARGSTHNGYNHGLSGVSTALNANISAQVNIFLMQECQKLIASTEQQQPIRGGLPCRPVSHAPETLQHIHPPQLNQHSNQQQMLSHLQAPKYFGSVQQQNSYFPMQMMSQVHRLNQQMNSWRQYPLPFAAPLPFFTPGIGMQNITYNNLAFAATAQQSPPTPHTEAPHIVHNTGQPHPQTPPVVTDPTTATTVDGNNSQPNPKIALASVEIKLTDLNKDQIAKLPVAFGFNLDDDGTSKILAQAAAENWYNLGKIAAMKPTGITKATQKGASISGSTEAGMLSTPKAPRISAILIESSNAPTDLPAGWTSQKFKRANSENKASDTYFYSPQEKIKFRSMKSCKRFIDILKEPTIGGNEQAALKEFKTRGHKL